MKCAMCGEKLIPISKSEYAHPISKVKNFECVDYNACFPREFSKNKMETFCGIIGNLVISIPFIMFLIWLL